MINSSTVSPQRPAAVASPGSRRSADVSGLVDPELETIKIYRRIEGAFVRVSELSVEQQDALTTPLLPEFSVTLAEATDTRRVLVLGAVHGAQGARGTGREVEFIIGIGRVPSRFTWNGAYNSSSPDTDVFRVR